MTGSVVNNGASPIVEQTMKTPEDVTVMMKLKKLGWGTARIAKELGISKNTVKRYLRHGGWVGYRRPKRSRQLDGLEEWIREAFHQHQGNAAVVREELKRLKGIDVSLRTVERMVVGLRRSLRAESVATVRFETPPGQQLQIDFGESKVSLGGEQVRVHLFVATLGYSRRTYVAAFPNQGQNAWLEGLEGAFRHFGGVPAEVLIDNAKALVASHHIESREVRFNERFQQFAGYWGFQPRACAPYRARTKGKDERAVQYVKRNAIAGRVFDSWAKLEAHLVVWTREVADQRVHGTTREQPIVRFEKEREVLKPLRGRLTFVETRMYARKVSNDALVDFNTDRYSVPWPYVGSHVEVGRLGGFVHIRCGGEEIARHPAGQGQHQLFQNAAHYEGIFRKGRPFKGGVETAKSELVRDLRVYEQLAGGAF